MSCPTHPQSIPWESSTGVRCGICGEPWPSTESTHAALLGQRIFEARCSTSTMTLDDAINAARVTLDDYVELGEHYQHEVDEMRVATAEVLDAAATVEHAWKHASSLWLTREPGGARVHAACVRLSNAIDAARAKGAMR